MRFIQSNLPSPKGEKPKKEKKEVPPKAGNKDYDYYNLSTAKKIPTKGGYK